MKSASSPRFLRATLALLCAGLLLPALAAQPLFRENFRNDTPKNTLVATEPRPEFNHWFAPQNQDDSVDGSRTHGWTWGIAKETPDWAVGFLLPTPPEEQAWLFRKLTDGGALPEGKAVAAPRLTALFNMAWGGNQDPTYFYNLALLDAAGNGYVAQVGRAGVVTLYRLDNGLRGGWTQLATKDTGIQSNTLRLTLSVENGNVGVSSTLVTQGNQPGPALSAPDAYHRHFSVLGVTGLGLSRSIDVRVRDIVLEGTLVPAAQ